MQIPNAGFQIVNNVFRDAELEPIRQELERYKLPVTRGGLRQADKKLLSVQQIAISEMVISLAQSLLTKKPRLIRAILFCKNTHNNWRVSWHQDKTVCVTEKFDCHGWGPWSVKENLPHVQPPLEVLQHMVSIRIHLDDTDETNGCLRVLPGSHQLGILTQHDIDNLIQNDTSAEARSENLKYENCIAQSGTVMLMSPLLLHSSGKATSRKNRRVLHLEYSDYNLPTGINWG